jgi:hypothetical protein
MSWSKEKQKMFEVTIYAIFAMVDIKAISEEAGRKIRRIMENEADKQ